jgi:hypothetical protein
MKNLNNIENDLQIIEDNLGLCINDIGTYKYYIDKDGANDVLKSLAFYYENNPPINNFEISLNIYYADIYQVYLQRLIDVFTENQKVFTLYYLS